MSSGEEPGAVIIFGRDVTQIPCFRDSWLYGIGTGFVASLVGFMGTSRTLFASKAGFYSMLGTTISYWFYCRYNYFQQKKHSEMLKEFIRSQDSILIAPIPESPPPPPDKPEIEIASVSYKRSS